MTRLSGRGEIPNNLPISTTNFTPTTNALGIGGQDAVVLDNFAAAAMLLERLDAPDGAARKIVLGGRCVVRGSTMRQI